MGGFNEKCQTEAQNAASDCWSTFFEKLGRTHSILSVVRLAFSPEATSYMLQYISRQSTVFYDH
jgi:hypothetical protein